MITLSLYADGHFIKSLRIEFNGMYIYEQRKAHIERVVDRMKSDYQFGLSLVNEWQFVLEAGSKMNDENFTNYEIELPEKSRKAIQQHHVTKEKKTAQDNRK